MTTTESSFNAQTEGLEVVERYKEQVRDKTVLVTGVGPNGLGEALAKALAAADPQLLIITARSVDKAQDVKDNILKERPSAKIRLLELDLASFDSVKKAAETVNGYAEPSVDILFNNAGVMNIPERTESADGFEMHLAVNHLGAFLFSNMIMPKLTAGAGARIVLTSSNGYAFSPFRFTDYNFKDEKALDTSEEPPKETLEQVGIPWDRGYLPTVAYAQSKTAGILFAVHLNELMASKGIYTVCVMPGAIETELWRHMPKEVTKQLMVMLKARSASQGISGLLVAALDPNVSESSCLYLEDCQPASVADFARDPARAEKLWKLSEELTRLHA